MALLALLAGTALVDVGNVQRTDFVARLNMLQHDDCVSSSREQVKLLLGSPTESHRVTVGKYSYEVWTYSTPASRPYPDLGTVVLSPSGTRYVFGSGEVADLPPGGLELLKGLYKHASCDADQVNLGSLMVIAASLTRMPREQSAAILREFVRTAPQIPLSIDVENPGRFDHAERFQLIQYALADWGQVTGVQETRGSNSLIALVKGWPVVLSQRLGPAWTGENRDLEWIESWRNGLKARKSFTPPNGLDIELATLGRKLGIPPAGDASFVADLRKQIER